MTSPAEPGHGETGPHQGPVHAGDQASTEPGGMDEFDYAEPVEAEPTGPDTEPDTGPDTEAEPVDEPTDETVDQAHPDTVLAAERLEDLRRLQAEYVNYKKRVDRDRAVAREHGISHVLESMLPVLDEIHIAREHGDLLDGPAGTIVDKLEAVLAKLGIERFGSTGDEFDPMRHEALMHTEADLPEGTTTTTVVQVLQPGYRMGERVVRAARVAVADPQQG